MTKGEVERIRHDVVTKRRFIHDGEIDDGGFFGELWRRQVLTPLKGHPDYLPKFAIA